LPNTNPTKTTAGETRNNTYTVTQKASLELMFTFMYCMHKISDINIISVNTQEL